MNVQSYNLVSNRRDKAIALAKGLVVEGFGIGMSWSLFVHFHDPVVQDFWPLWLVSSCILVLLVGPVVLIDTLTTRICIGDRGISATSAVKRLGEPWISWEQLVRVDVESSPICVSGIKRVVVRGRHEMHGIPRPYWITRKIVIPGHLPDIQSILASLQEHAGDKFVGQIDADG